MFHTLTLAEWSFLLPSGYVVVGLLAHVDESADQSSQRVLDSRTKASRGLLCRHIFPLSIISATNFDVLPALDVILVESVKWILGLLLY